MTRKRSRYRPRPVNPMAHQMAMMGAALISQDDQTVWALQIDDAVRAVGRGQATQDQWRTIFNGVNLVEQLIRMRKAEDPDGVVQAAQDACLAILERQRETGKRAVRASELTALHELRAAWVTLMSGITQSERFQAEEAIGRRVQAALSGHAPEVQMVKPLFSGQQGA